MSINVKRVVTFFVDETDYGNIIDEPSEPCMWCLFEAIHGFL